ncbi:ABC-2 type transporter [Streptococcus pseudoporcinus]|uniref:ABC-2 type transporter n=1 Tax=Streptococcus pseudoporcinus TaxID=361101 RepID=A0A4U9ZKJ0_9STRE|nr:ABC transporter permease [Streptococcus pseudoporcinus]VTS41283.1 ABC-2 type transporter [Streptococcus pseudoporcinus]
MKALLKIEWIKLWREWPVFILAIGMPVGFFLFYSGMTMLTDPKTQKTFVQSYMLTMTAFSMSSFGLFSFPMMLFEDQKNHWLVYLEHANVTIFQYYLSKIIRVYVSFICSIVATFMVAALFRHVDLSFEGWVGSAILLLVSGIVFLLLAVIGGSWMPISTFPSWMQKISKLTPTYHVNKLVTQFADKLEVNGKSLLIILGYAIIVILIALAIKRRKEVSI